MFVLLLFDITEIVILKYSTKIKFKKVISVAVWLLLLFV